MQAAYATMKGIKVMRVLRKDQTELFYFGPTGRDASGERRF